MINRKLDNNFSESLELSDTIFDNVEGIAANVVTLYFLIKSGISEVIGFFCNHEMSAK